MSTYGRSHYGPPTLYGRQRPVRVVPGGGTLPLISNNYLVDPFTAVPVNYTTVLLTWNGPDPTTSTPMTGFRLLSSRYGFPVDENDGTVLFDTASLPGKSATDQSAVPGQVSYYGYYINSGTGWIRAGFTACLMPVNHGYAGRLWGYLPEYIRDLSDVELTADNAGDPFLWQFLQVPGWALDYLKTQYDFLLNGQNDPMKVSQSDLAALAEQVGMPYSAEVPAYFTRKGAANWATVMRQRGSLDGIAEHVSLLSGYGADIELSRNIMLEDDQSLPADPVFPPWSAGTPYHVGEIVTWPDYPAWTASQAYVVNNYVYYQGAAYQCTATGGQGVPPAGAASSGTYWAVASGPYLYQCAAAVTSLPGTAPPGALPVGDFPDSNSTWTLYYDQDAASAYTAVTGLAGGVSTWEALQASSPTTGAPAGSLTEGIGLPAVSNFGNDFTGHSLRLYNKSGSAKTMWLRSLSRQAADITAGSAVPDPQVVVSHAVPVPQAAAEWEPSARYTPGDLALSGGVNWLALRASTGAQPPAAGEPLNANTDFEAGTAPWTAAGNSPVTRSTAQSFHGSSSLALTPTGTDARPSAVSEQVTVIPGASYAFSAFAYIAAGRTLLSGGAQVDITWYDPWGQFISATAGTAAAVPAAAWTSLPVSGTAPLNAATAALTLQVNGTPGSSVVSYWDMAVLRCTGTPEWAQLGTDARVPLTLSAQAIQNVSQSTTAQYQLTPFTEWYDSWGGLITRVFARVATPGTPGTPPGYTFDSFTTGAGVTLAGRLTDTGDQNWAVPAGDWLPDGSGTAYPPGSGTPSLALVSAPLSCTQAVTFTRAPQAGTATALVFWYQSASAYWAATMTGLYYYSSGTWTLAAAYATPLAAGDRLYVVTSQATPSVTVYRNRVGSYSGGTGQVAALTGGGVPSAVKPGSSTAVYSGISSGTV